jgi:hypothetical protein
MVDNDAMVTAIFRAVADFAELPEEKLKAIIRAGKIAGAFCCPATEQDARDRGLPRSDLERRRRLGDHLPPNNSSKGIRSVAARTGHEGSSPGLVHR